MGITHPNYDYEDTSHNTKEVHQHLLTPQRTAKAVNGIAHETTDRAEDDIQEAKHGSLQA